MAQPRPRLRRPAPRRRTPIGTGSSPRILEDYFAANPVFGVYAGRHEYDGRMQDFSAGSDRTGNRATSRRAGPGRRVRRREPRFEAGIRTRLSAVADRRRPLLACRGGMAVPQPGLLPGLARSGRISQQALRAARAADACLYRLREDDSERGGADPRESSYADAAAVDRLWCQRLRGFRGLLSQGRGTRVRRGSRRRVAGGAETGKRRRREGNARARSLARVRAIARDR